MSDQRLVADQLLELLVSWDVPYVFACPGSTEAAILSAAARRHDLRLLLTTHEGVAVSMADGYGRTTGRPAVAYLHANVGLTNGLSHLYAAQIARSPVVLLNGLKQTAIQNRGGFTTAPHMRDFVRQYVKSDWQSLRPEAVIEDVNRALRLSNAAPQGPTWVGLPQDLVEAEVPVHDLDVASYRISGRTTPSTPELRELADRLCAARRPILVAGADVDKGGCDALVELAERTGATVLAEDRRTWEISAFPSHHPQYGGMYNHHRQSVATADLLVFVGARCFVEFEAPTEPELPAGVPVLQLHPDPAEVAKIYGVALGLTGDAGATLERLLEYLPRDVDPATAPSRASQVAEARREHAAIRERVLEIRDSDWLTVPTVMRALADRVDANTTVVSDATTSGGTLLFAMEGTGARVHATSSGSLGWGMGAALGAALATPERRTVAVLGDGVFQFGLPALWTAKRYAIDVQFLVINNQAYAAVGAAIRRYSGALSDAERQLTVDLAGPRIADVAAGFGVPSFRAESVEQLQAAFDGALGLSGPTLIEVMTDPLDLGP